VRALLPMLFACGLLAGCDAPRGDALFPLAKGHRWHYRMTTTYEDPAVAAQVEHLTLRAEGVDTVDDAKAWRRRSASGMAYWLRSDETGIFRVASQGPLDAQPRPDKPVRYVLKQPLVPGTAWEAATTPYVLQRRNEFPRELRYLGRYRALEMKYRIEQVGQQVRTPAGSFDGCVVVHGVAEIRLLVDELFAYRDVPITAREWYCPGVGLVRQERVEHSPTKFLLGGSVTLELVDWE
jgi:hypothetical protein